MRSHCLSFYSLFSEEADAHRERENDIACAKDTLEQVERFCELEESLLVKSSFSREEKEVADEQITKKADWQYAIVSETLFGHYSNEAYALKCRLEKRTQRLTLLSRQVKNTLGS